MPLLVHCCLKINAITTLIAKWNQCIIADYIDFILASECLTSSIDIPFSYAQWVNNVLFTRMALMSISLISYLKIKYNLLLICY